MNEALLPSISGSRICSTGDDSYFTGQLKAAPDLRYNDTIPKLTYQRKSRVEVDPRMRGQGIGLIPTLSLAVLIGLTVFLMGASICRRLFGIDLRLTGLPSVDLGKVDIKNRTLVATGSPERRKFNNLLIVAAAREDFDKLIEMADSPYEVLQAGSDLDLG